MATKKVRKQRRPDVLGTAVKLRNAVKAQAPGAAGLAVQLRNARRRQQAVNSPAPPPRAGNLGGAVLNLGPPRQRPYVSGRRKPTTKKLRKR